MKTSVLARDLETVREIVLEQLRGYKVRVYLFGSQATGKADRYSDIDVGVLPLDPLPDLVFFNIREALNESDVIRTVDVVNLLEAGDKLRQRVSKEGILWRE
jgi:predicted nucleotidyltransferase